MQTTIEWNISKNLSPQQDVKKLKIKNHLKHTWYGFKTYKPFPLVIFSSFKVNHFLSFDLIEWRLCFIGMNVVMG
jgi:hypothetical protein